MGRKIPAKKHRGVKDPLEQIERRFQSIKGKINAPPKDPDEQPIPRSVTRLFAFQNKDNKKAKKIIKKGPSHAGAASVVTKNPISNLKKLPGESGRTFSLRINSAIRTLHDPLEQDYPQDLEADDVKGEHMAAYRARRQRKRKRDAATDSSQEKLTRGQKLTLKKNAKKQKMVEESRSEFVYERVSFGDVTHAPPSLPAPRRAPTQTCAPRPGRRDLLLSAMLSGNSKSSDGKKCAVTPAEALRRERVRLDVVAAYRQLNKQRQMEKNNKKKIKKL